MELDQGGRGSDLVARGQAGSRTAVKVSSKGAYAAICTVAANSDMVVAATRHPRVF